MGDPHTSAHACVADAKRFGTFRAEITSAPSSCEFEGELVPINECWLEQRLVQDMLYSPWRNTDVFFLCFNLKRSNSIKTWQDLEVWPYLYHSSPRRTCYQIGEVDSVFVFSLTLAELASNQATVAFEEGVV
jgi:hypothetical protein